VDLIYIDPPFNSNRNYEVFWGETREKRSFQDRHASTLDRLDWTPPHQGARAVRFVILSAAKDLAVCLSRGVTPSAVEGSRRAPLPFIPHSAFRIPRWKDLEP
jgi:hypothetical protein